MAILAFLAITVIYAALVCAASIAYNLTPSGKIIVISILVASWLVTSWLLYGIYND